MCLDFQSTNLANLFASHGAREQIKYKPSTKLKHKFNPTLDVSKFT